MLTSVKATFHHWQFNELPSNIYNDGAHFLSIWSAIASSTRSGGACFSTPEWSQEIPTNIIKVKTLDNTSEKGNNLAKESSIERTPRDIVNVSRLNTSLCMIFHLIVQTYYKQPHEEVHSGCLVNQNYLRKMSGYLKGCKSPLFCSSPQTLCIILSFHLLLQVQQVITIQSCLIHIHHA